jgi:hypothetical protein
VWADVWQYDGVARSEAIVRQSTRSGANRCAATLSPAILSPQTPPSFTPSRIELSSGYFDIDAMVTLAEPRRPQPRPELILPIVARRLPSSIASPAKQVAAAGVGVGTARTISPMASPERRARRADVLALVGFGLAWLATTASGAVLAGRWLAAARQSAPVLADVVCPSSTLPSTLPSKPCPGPGWEPPLVAVKDLPRASEPETAHAPVRRPGARIEAHTASAIGVSHVVRSHMDAPSAEWGGRSRRAKTAPAPPRSLEDWIRGAVGPAKDAP